MAETLLFRIENGVGWIVLNRPEARNAMNAEMRQAFLDALARAAAEADIRAVVLTGTGKAFCTGADLSGSRAATGAAAPPGPGDTRRAMLPSQRVIRTLWELEKPAREWGERLAQGPTFALGLSKRLLNRALQSDLETCLAEEAFTQALVAQSEDMREGIRSFMEKRPPTFKGR